ncbi:MAG: hypothetical protein HYR67_04425 [Bacteroidetes bacterium]|nr:hypothetical protein [Bacteroidota bacterium]
MAEKLRKEIHLPKDILKDLKIVAAYADKSVKKYMEDLVIQDVKGKAPKLLKIPVYDRR